MHFLFKLDKKVEERPQIQLPAPPPPELMPLEEKEEQSNEVDFTIKPLIIELR